MIDVSDSTIWYIASVSGEKNYNNLHPASKLWQGITDLCLLILMLSWSGYLRFESLSSLLSSATHWTPAWESTRAQSDSLGRCKSYKPSANASGSFSNPSEFHSPVAGWSLPLSPHFIQAFWRAIRLTLASMFLNFGTDSHLGISVELKV